MIDLWHYIDRWRNEGNGWVLVEKVFRRMSPHRAATAYDVIDLEPNEIKRWYAWDHGRWVSVDGDMA